MRATGTRLRRALALVSAVLLVATLLVPWWRLKLSVDVRQGRLDVFPYVIRSIPPETMEAILSAGSWRGGSTTRTPEMSAHTAILVIGIALCVLGGFVSGAKAAAALGGAGVLLSLDVYWFLKRIRQVANEVYRIPTQGHYVMNQPLGTIYVETQFQPGLYLAFAAAALALVAAVLAFALRGSRE